MADFRVGSTAIADMKVGSTQIQRVYVGSTQIWEAGTNVDYRASNFADSGTVQNQFPVTSGLSVQSTDFVLYYAHGKQTSASLNPNGTDTGTLGNPTGIAGEFGDSGNDYLINLYATNSTNFAGTVSLGGGQYSAIGMIAVSDADSYSISSTDTSSTSVSVSNCTLNDLIVIFHTVQTLQRGGYYYPSTPSGYTQLVQQSWLSGQGGAAQNWTTTVYYKEGGSGTESYSASTSGDFDGYAILRIYKS